MAGPTDLITDNVLGSSSRESQQDAFLAYMQNAGLEFDEYANEVAELDPGGDDGNATAANDSLGIDPFEIAKKNPVQAEMDEQSQILEGVTRDSIKEIRSPRNQAYQIDRTMKQVGDKTCDEISSAIQALLKGEITPKTFGKLLKGIGGNAANSLLKDGLALNDLKQLGKKAALIGAALLADRVGLDDQLEAMLDKFKRNKRKISDISNTKKSKDDAMKDIFSQLPPVVRQILKGDKDALQKFIDQKCNEARGNMTNSIIGRAGLSGKVRDFVDNK